jgi:hypothetical protein
VSQGALFVLGYGYNDRINSWLLTPSLVVQDAREASLPIAIDVAIVPFAGCREYLGSAATLAALEAPFVPNLVRPPVQLAA